jgi:mRNA interferase MazF
LATGLFVVSAPKYHQRVVGFDETIEPLHPDFAHSGLKAASLIRLGFLAVLPSNQFLGIIGSISLGRHMRLLQRLSVCLVIRTAS